MNGQPQQGGDTPAQHATDMARAARLTAALAAKDYRGVESVIVEDLQRSVPLMIALASRIIQLNVEANPGVDVKPLLDTYAAQTLDFAAMKNA